MERPKNRYHIAFQCTKNGVLRSNMTYYVNASSDAEAKRLVKEAYPDAKSCRIIGKWENKPRNANYTRESITPKAAEAYTAERKVSKEESTAKECNCAHFAVIDIETTWSDQIMSIGVVIANANTFLPVDCRYYTIPSACKHGGMYSDALFVKTPVSPIQCSKRDAIKDLCAWLDKYQVKDICAYNAKFDKTHLPELKKLYWHDIMHLAAYRQFNPKIPADAECCGTGRLKRGYGVEPILRMLSGNRNYFETHNAILDALDELKIMQCLGHDLEKYGTV